MKKIYLILGNKPFEEKLTEQLSKTCKLVGSSDHTGDDIVNELSEHHVDVLIVRESLADNRESLLSFLKQSRSNNPELKVVAILQSHDVGDSILYEVAKLGVFDIINGGTRLSDVIMMATRESTPEDVVTLLTPEQYQSLLYHVQQSESEKPLVMDMDEEDDIVIELSGELEEDVESKTGFKERYMSGITQVYSSHGDEDSLPDAPEISSVREIKPIETTEGNPYAHLPGYQPSVVENPVNKEEYVKPVYPIYDTPSVDIDESGEDDLLSLNSNIKKEPREEPVINLKEPTIEKEILQLDKTDESPSYDQEKVVLHFVSHCLMSSVATQLAFELSKNRSVIYIETDEKNKMFQSACEKKGIDYRFVNESDDIEVMIEEFKRQKNKTIVINTKSDAHLLCPHDQIVYEMVQDRQDAVIASERLNPHKKAIVVFSYFEPDLPSIKSLTKTVHHKGLKWTNTRIEEYNARLNTKVLSNETVIDLAREV